MTRSSPPPEQSDEELLRLYAQGEQRAFNELYNRHEMRVWRFLFRGVRIQSLADELLQEVWFAVARQAARFEPTARFTTWLFTIAHNRMVDYFRGAKGDPARAQMGLEHADAPELEEALPADSCFGPLQRLQSKEQALALLDAIEQLPFPQREAFLLQAEAGMDVQEIATTTGVSFETAKSRLRYARNRLRQILQEYA